MNQESGKTGGFLSKMLQKVTGSSAQEPADLAASDEGSGKEALHQMVERKRRDDAIRAQEFAELRQLRSQSGRGGPPARMPASAFLPSALDAEDHGTTTLRKINAIEAQMAQQWLRTADGCAPVTDAVPPVADARAAASSPAPGRPPGMTAAQWQAIPTLGEESRVPPVPVGTADGAGFAITPDIEEAAILFAHGDLDGAKARLLELLVQGLDHAPVDRRAVAGIWQVVLDLYRAIGDEEGFEPLALDWASYFGHAAPVWFSMPQQLGMASLDMAAGLQPTARDGLAGVIEGDATPWLQALQARARLGTPLEISCERLIRLDFVAAGMVLNWAAEMQVLGHQLRFTQLHHLVAVFLQVIGIEAHAKLQLRAP
jgi:hypothetical protein